ncbi:MAG: CHAD domain-containing protein [Polyangiales bacterium]
MTLPDDILLRTPEEASRRVALALLERARAAAARLDDPQDDEALHDFRVAIRRLRSTLRAWRPHLKDSVGKKQEKALRSLQRATGGGRDAEVLVEWIEAIRPELHSSHRVGVDWLLEDLRRRRDEAYGEVRGDIRQRFRAVDAKLTERLRWVSLEVDLLGERRPETYGEALARNAGEHLDDLRSRLARIEGARDDDNAHGARIRCKRLRYLVDPVAKQLPEAKRVAKRCKRLQDVLGDMNDAARLAGEVGAAIERAAADHARRLHELARDDPEGPSVQREVRRSERPGLVELTRRGQSRIDELYDELSRDWLGEDVGGLGPRVDALGSRLRQLAGVPPAEGRTEEPGEEPTADPKHIRTRSADKSPSART